MASVLSAVVLAQRSLLRHPLESDVHVHFELDEILRTLRCIDNQIGTLILRDNAPNSVRRDLVPTKLHFMILRRGNYDCACWATW